MRTHRKYTTFGGRRLRGQVEELAETRCLAAARLEPVVRGLRGGAMLDLIFTAGGRVAVVPFIEIAPEMLQQREMSPFVWPHESAAILGVDRADAIERTLLPWIESLTLARQLNEETLRFFGDGSARDVFEHAREARFLGAAPYADVLKDAAPYVYAMRFAENHRINVCDAGGALGSALLSKIAPGVRADLGNEQLNALARQWYGCDLFGSIDESSACDVWIAGPNAVERDAGVRITLDGASVAGINVEVATPVPTDVFVSFDPQDAPVCRTFSIEVRDPRPLRPPLLASAPQAEGGSSGRVLMLMRDDFARVPDADSDEAAALAGLLRAEGFTVDLAPSSCAHPSSYDLVHAFNLARVNELAPALAEAHAAGVPLVISPFLQDVAAQGAWGTGIVRAFLRIASDEIDLEDNLQLLAQRRLEGAGLSAKRQEPFAGYDEAVRTALQRAGAVVTYGSQEDRLLSAFGYTGPAIASGPCIPRGDADGAAAAIVGTGDYAFAHAPLEARSNLLILVRAAVDARVPLVIAGPVVEPEYALAVREQAGERVVLLAEPESGVAEALYRGARVFADVSWVPFGPHRAVRAAASGAALVLAKDTASRGRLGDEGIWEADPASQASIGAALRDAWKHAGERPQTLEAPVRRAVALGESRAALVAAVQAYAAAQQARVPV